MGSTLILALLTMFPGCTTPTTDVVDKPEKVVPGGKTGKPGKSAKYAKNKGGKSGKGKSAKGGKNGKTQPPGGPPPIGVAGPATGQLKLALSEDAPPIEAPAEVIPGAPPPPSGKATEATLAFAFSDGSTKDVPVGRVPGNCTETDPKPIGPEGKQQTPLWAVKCVDGETTVDIAIAQIGPTVSVLRAPEPAEEGAPPQYKVVKRVRLVPGVTLTKKQG